MADQPQGESLSVSSAASALEDIAGQILDEIDEEEDGEAEPDDEGESKEKPEDEDEAESEEESEAKPDDEELAPIESLADIAQALDQPLETVLDNLKATIKVNGEESTVTLRELTQGYQRDADYRHKTSQLAEERRGFESERQQKLTEVQNQHLILGKVVQQLEQLVFADVNTAELERLRHENPAEYVLRRQDIADRQRRYQEIMQQGANGWAQTQQELTQAQQKQLSDLVTKEREALSQRIPNWSDADRENVAKYLNGSYGYSNEEIGQLIDHRAVDIARKAMLYDQQQVKAKEVTQKVKQLPKLIKPAKATGPVNVQKTAIKQARQRFKSTGKVKDAARLIENLL
jgi:hypothetical protein